MFPLSKKAGPPKGRKSNHISYDYLAENSTASNASLVGDQHFVDQHFVSIDMAALDASYVSMTVTSGSSIYYPITSWNYVVPSTIMTYCVTDCWSKYYIGQVSPQSIIYNNCYPVTFQPETPEYRAKREALQLDAEVRARAADSRADKLLMSFLSDEQATQFREEARFDLKINGKHYRINKGRSGNVHLIENGKPVAKYCAHPVEWTPNGDTMLAQMMLLKTDELAFLKVANRTALV
jgi:hypothetical protein